MHFTAVDAKYSSLSNAPRRVVGATRAALWSVLPTELCDAPPIRVPTNQFMLASDLAERLVLQLQSLVAMQRY